MSKLTRREFLKQVGRAGVGGTAAVLQGGSILSTLVSCQDQGDLDPLKSGTFLRAIPFVDEGNLPFNQLIGEGLDARKFFDLATVKASGQTTPNDLFFVRTGTPDLPKALQPWPVKIAPGQGSAQTVAIDELIPAAAPLGPCLLECAGNDLYSHFGLMGVAEWSGIPLVEILKKYNFPRDGLIKVTGFDKHKKPGLDSVEGASWLFPWSQLEESSAFLATEMNGTPLANDFGSPVRLVVPGMYAAAHLKWISEITFEPENAPSTSQMIEYASKTHQFGEPALAKDYIPPVIDFAALPIRIEQWLVRDKIAYLVAGLAWGGTKAPDPLLIRFKGKTEYVPVKSFQRDPAEPWSLWSHVWQDPQPGKYRIQLQARDRTIPTRRLDVGYYARKVQIPKQP